MATELQTMNKQREKNNLQTVSTTISPVLCDLQREH
jgi:AAA15 family ATPase/GTPase